jgi:hypothetical protein
MNRKSFLSAMILSLTFCSLSSFAGPCEEANQKRIDWVETFKIFLDPAASPTSAKECLAAGRLSVLTDEIIFADVQCEEMMDKAIRASGKEKTKEQIALSQAKALSDFKLRNEAMKYIDDCISPQRDGFTE